MPDASATKPAHAFGLTAKIFLASALLVVAVLGITFGVTSVKANHTADASIHRALLSTRRAVDDYLAARTRTLGRASTVATDVPQYRQRLLNQRSRELGDVLGATIQSLQTPLVSAAEVAEAMAVDRNGRPGEDPIDRRVVDIGRDEAGVGDERGALGFRDIHTQSEIQDHSRRHRGHRQR